MQTNATPLSLLSKDRSALIISPNATQFVNRLKALGYPASELFVPPIEEPTTVGKKAWGYCAWITQALRLSAGLEVACLLLFCCIFATVWWFCVERPRRIVSFRKRTGSDEEPIFELQNCCRKKDEHESD